MCMMVLDALDLDAGIDCNYKRKTACNEGKMTKFALRFRLNGGL